MFSSIYSNVSLFGSLFIESLSGSLMISHKQQEDTFDDRCGMRIQALKALFQTIQVHTVISQADEVLKIADPAMEISSTVKLVCVGTPFALILVRRTIESIPVEIGEGYPLIVGYARRVFSVIKDHIGTAAQVAAAVAYCAMIYFGQRLLGTLGLAWITLGFASRHDVEVCKENKPVYRGLMLGSAVAAVYMTIMNKPIDIAAIETEMCPNILSFSNKIEYRK